MNDRHPDALPPGTWDPNRWPTDEEWADWFLAADRDAQLAIARRMIEAAQSATDCFIRNHEGHIDGLRRDLETARDAAQTVTIHAVCPACPKSLTFTTTVHEFWGHIDPLDSGCVSVTRPYTKEVEDHLTAHRIAGELTEAMLKRYRYYAEYAPGVAERLTALTEAEGA